MLAVALAVVGMALSASSAPASCRPPVTDPPYECRYHFQNAQHLFYWDMTQLRSPTYYTAVQTGSPNTYFFNICGDASHRCIPWDNNTYMPCYGVAVQRYSSVCVLAGEGNPIFEPRDPSNPTTGGVNITHFAAPEQPEDPHRCKDDDSGDTIVRTTKFMMSCDPSVATLVTDYVKEEGECQYVFAIRSKFACGRIYDGPDSAAGAAKENAERWGEAFAAMGLMVLGAVLFIGGWGGVHYYFHRELPYSIPFVGNLAAGPSTGAAAGASGGFGSSSGTSTGFGSGASGAYATVGTT